ncbi:MAG: bifunctional homocysteine S-methyltransferase/methylenetetrahydrofolate reductase [Bdellovibrionales bacterium]|nr:bifunctional homocysteine S-methyltransferase/methylenetetrahydrofolate reductase [Bdellovibrionales bacterium]
MDQHQSLIQFLEQSDKVIVADGNLSTTLYDRGFYINRSFEELSLTHPEVVREATASFQKAGAVLLSTNTFGANIPKLIKYGLQDQLNEMISASCNITQSLAQERDLYVLACMGPLGRVLEPLGPTSFLEAVEFFSSTVMCFEKEKIDGYSLVGFHDLKELKAAIVAIQQHTQKPILAHMGIQDNQRTNYGHSLHEFVLAMEELDVSVIGLSGDVGPSGMLTALQTMRPLTKKRISLLPNAGFPRLINDQYIYMCNPDYIGKYTKRFIQAGVNIVGGHSGVGEAHIRAIANAVKMHKVSLVNGVKDKELTSGTQVVFLEPKKFGLTKMGCDVPKTETPLAQRSRLGEKLARGERILSVEVVPPRGKDGGSFLDLCQKLQRAHIEFVNIPDGARAVAKMSSLHLSAFLKSKFSLEPIPHFTARDRNLIGIQADLLGAHVNGVRDLLLVTGDPPKLGNCPGATGVYDVDAIGLTHIVHQMNQGLDLGGSSFGEPTQFVIGVALNPTANNQELEIKRLRYKIEAGADFIMTQPIYDVEAFKNFLMALGPIQIPIIMGIWPLVSLRNAEFLKNEVPGVSVPDWVIEKMEKAGDIKEDAIRQGLEIALETMSKTKPLVAGFQVSAPFNKIDIALEVINEFN